MTRITQLADRAAIAASAMLDGVGDARSMPAPEWAAAVAEIEAVGRLVDAARVAIAGATAGTGRSLPAVAEPLGARSGADALAGCAGVSEREAARRIALADALTASTSLTGAFVAERFPVIASALREGRIGLDAAAVIVRELDAVRIRAAADDLVAAETGLVTLGAARAGAVPARTEYVVDAAKAWSSAIDPDGARPREERMLRRRAFRIGVEDADGGRAFGGYLAAEPALMLESLIEAHRRAGTGVGFVDGTTGAAVEQAPDAAAMSSTADTLDEADTDDAAEMGDAADALDELVVRDDRSPQQQRHDAFAAIITVAARSLDAPTIGGAPPAVLITVSADDLHDPAGRDGDPIGRVDGAATAFSRAAVERAIDRGGMQEVLLSHDGAIVGIRSVQRCFTAAQRRAIMARDGGCVIPGCRIPASWCEVHHVRPWRDGGTTTTDNGVLLCWWHHTRIDTGPWRIAMIHGVPHVRGPGMTRWRRHRPVLRRRGTVAAAGPG